MIKSNLRLKLVIAFKALHISFNLPLVVDLLDKIKGLIEDRANGKGRIIIAISGPPASGKSTLSDQLASEIKDSVLVPMDGFHLDNQTLDQMGQREVKGAPHTFDGDGFVDLIKRIKFGKLPVKIPEFDRRIDSVVVQNRVVNVHHRVIIVEGNYLLLDQDPWRQLPELFDLTLMLKPSLETIEYRLIQRWLDHGFSQELARQKAELNDIPNAKLVMQSSFEADFTIEPS